jgi:hypothetical protein
VWVRRLQSFGNDRRTKDATKRVLYEIGSQFDRTAGFDTLAQALLKDTATHLAGYGPPDFVIRASGVASPYGYRHAVDWYLQPGRIDQPADRRVVMDHARARWRARRPATAACEDAPLVRPLWQAPGRPESAPRPRRRLSQARGAALCKGVGGPGCTAPWRMSMSSPASPGPAGEYFRFVPPPTS